MPRTVSALLPSTSERLRQFGERLRLARLRRRLTARQVAARAGMAPMTLRSVERGGAGVTIGAYAAVMQILGVEQDFDLIVAADPTGRALQDARLSAPRRAAWPERSMPPSEVRDMPDTPFGTHDAPVTPSRPAPARPAGRAAGTPPGKAAKHSRVQAAQGFISARELASVIDAPSAPRSNARRR